MSFTFPRESEILLSDASELCFIVFSSLFFIRDIFPKTFIVYGEKSHFARDQYCELCINLAIIPIFLFFWGRWGHPAMSGKLRYGRKRTFTDMDGHLRTAGDSQQSAWLLSMLPHAHSSCKNLYDIAYGRWCLRTTEGEIFLVFIICDLFPQCHRRHRI